jgi:hypothetical protein
MTRRSSGRHVSLHRRERDEALVRDAGSYTGLPARCLGRLATRKQYIEISRSTPSATPWCDSARCRREETDRTREITPSRLASAPASQPAREMRRCWSSRDAIALVDFGVHMKAIVSKLCATTIVCLFAAGAWADAPVSKEAEGARDAVTWTLKVGEQTYGMRPEGGPIPLPSELDWSCRYSARRTKTHENMEDSAVHVTCTRSDSRFSFMPTCTRPIKKGAAPESVPSKASQAVTLFTGNQIVVVGVSCDAS